jgi:hypothetical protein
MNRISVRLASLCSFIKIESAPGRAGDCCLSVSASVLAVPNSPMRLGSDKEGGEDPDGTRGENADDSTWLEQYMVSLLVALTSLRISSSIEPLDEKFVVILDEPEEDVGGGDGFDPIPRSRKMASPTQSLHFC